MTTSSPTVIQDENKLSGRISKNNSLSISPGFVLSSCVLFGVLFLIISDIEFASLANWQNDNFYRQLSGFLILLIVFLQWRLFMIKNSGRVKLFQKASRRHQYWGILIPFVLYLHSASLGFGYQKVLYTLFLIVLFTGIFNPFYLKLRSRVFYSGWLFLHVSSAALVMIIIVYHVYITYTYS